MVPKSLGVGADPLVQHRPPVHLGGDAAGRDPDPLVVRVAVEERPGNEAGLEHLVEQHRPVRALGHHLVGGSVLLFPHLVAHLGQVEPQRLGEDLVGGEHRVLEAERGVHRLLRPIGGRPVAAEQQPDAGRRGSAVAQLEQARQHDFLDPAVALPVGGEDGEVSGPHRRPPAFELRRQFLPERGADFRGLAQVGHDPNPVAASHRRQQPVAD